jgi:hypothetical protein
MTAKWSILGDRQMGRFPWLLTLNEAVALIGHFQQEFGHKKAERLDISEKTFGNVPIPRQL